MSCKKEESDTVNSISDNNFYMMIGTSLINCYVDIYNQNLAGKPTGSQNITADGPMGGTVFITGTTTYDDTHGITTTDLLFDLYNLNYTYTYTDNGGKTWQTQLNIIGSTTYSGSFSSDYTSVNHQSENLQIHGTVSYDGTSRMIDSNGPVNINRSNNTSVNIFGHVVSW
ncbi:MAG: hypothetical protein JW731_02585 [Bacteroidales bacterium]|nr:hypothetical protein [Bacteroidales bacterium]